MNASLRGIFLTSDKPEEVARFYRDVASLDLERVGKEGQYVYWKVDKGGIQIAVHDAAQFAAYTHPVCLDSNVTHLYFKIEGQAEFVEHLRRLHIEPYATDDVVVTITDPDGRQVMFGTA